MVATAVTYLLARARLRPSLGHQSIDVIVPAFNEEPVIERSLINLLRNPYVRHVICVDDGSTDRTAEVVTALTQRTPRLISSLSAMAARDPRDHERSRACDARYVFLTDADTRVPSKVTASAT